jgi:hypothetical protein
MDLPLNLHILRTVQSFGKLPRPLLYQKVPASKSEIDRQVSILASEGVITMEGDQVISADFGKTAVSSR